MAPAKPGLALSMSAPEVRRKSPGGFGRLKRTRGNVAETASLLDDSDEEILDFCGVSRRAVWLAMVWALPVSLAPLAILIQPFRSAVWYRILAIALAKSGELDTLHHAGCKKTKSLACRAVLPKKKLRPASVLCCRLLTHWSHQLMLSVHAIYSRGLQELPLSSGANGLQCVQTCFPYACALSSRISIPMPRGTFEQILSCPAESPESTKSLFSLNPKMPCSHTSPLAPPPRRSNLFFVQHRGRPRLARLTLRDGLDPGTHGITP
jgi:hypothetical protein